jgi:hypothetical protein
MSVPINQAIIMMGAVRANIFSRDCFSGQWVDFRVNFPERFTSDLPRVIITPNNLGAQENYNPAVVGMVHDVSSSEFYISAKNSDMVDGFAGFNWMAVRETPKKRYHSPIGLMEGTLRPKHFQPDGVEGDWQSWNVEFGSPLERTPVLLVSPCSQSVAQSLAAAVGIIRDASNKGFTLAARSSDCVFGSCNFSYLAAYDIGDCSFSRLDSGWLTAKKFESDCAPGDWQHWKVSFHEPFDDAPLVFLTASGSPINAETAHFPQVPAVGIAQNVTAEGFTLAAKNPECSDGYAGFYWVALGR